MKIIMFKKLKIKRNYKSIMLINTQSLKIKLIRTQGGVFQHNSFVIIIVLYRMMTKMTIIYFQIKTKFSTNMSTYPSRDNKCRELQLIFIVIAIQKIMLTYQIQSLCLLLITQCPLKQDPILQMIIRSQTNQVRVPMLSSNSLSTKKPKKKWLFKFMINFNYQIQIK